MGTCRPPVMTSNRVRKNSIRRRQEAHGECYSIAARQHDEARANFGCPGVCESVYRHHVRTGAGSAAVAAERVSRWRCAHCAGHVCASCQCRPVGEPETLCDRCGRGAQPTACHRAGCDCRAG